MADLPLRHNPLLAALREVVANTLGAPRRLICTVAEKQHHVTTALAAEDLFSADHLDFCLQVMGGEPRRFFASGLPDGSLRNLLVELVDGRAVQVTQCHGAAKQSCRIELFTARGSAVAALPGRLHWRAGPVRWSRVMRCGNNSCRQSLRAFHRALVSGEISGPDLRDLLRSSRWQQLAAESWRRGMWAEASASASS
jgi:predicted dehydrogenase